MIQTKAPTTRSGGQGTGAGRRRASATWRRAGATRRSRAAILALSAALGLSGCDAGDRSAAHAAFERGQSLERAGDLAAATQAYADSLAADGSNIRALMALGRLAEASEATGAALVYYHRAAETGWPGNRAFEALARLYRTRGENAEALRYAAAGVRLNPRNPDVLALKAAAMREAGLAGGAIEAAARALKLAPEHPEATLTLAHATAEEQGPEAALALLSRAPGRHHPEALAARLAMIDAQGRPRDAIDVLRLEILRIRRGAGAEDAEGGALSRNLAERLTHRGALDAAAEALDLWLEHEPGDLETLLARAELCLARHGLARARARLSRGLVAAGIEEGGAAALRLAATLSITAGAHGEAERLLRRAEAASDAVASPEPAALMRARAVRWEQAGNRAAALQTALGALIAEPQDEIASAMVLRHAAVLEQTAAASAALEAATAEAGGVVPVTTALTILTLRSSAGPSDALEEAFAQLLRRSGTDNRVAIGWAAYLEATGRRAQADALLSTLQKARPGARPLALALGRLKIRQEDAGAVLALARSLTEDAATRAHQAPVVVRLVNEAMTAGLGLAETQVAALSANLPARAQVDLALLIATASAQPDEALLAEAPARDEGYLMMAEQTHGVDPAAALGYLDRGLMACRQTLRLRLRRAALLESIGRREDALSEYAVLHALAPHSLVVVNNFASLLAETSDDPAKLARASELAGRLQAYDLPEFLDTRGWIAARRGALDEGVTLLERAAGALEDRPAVHYHLGLALFWDGQEERARDALVRAVNLDTEGRFRYYDTAVAIVARLNDGVKKDKAGERVEGETLTDFRIVQ